MRVLRPLVAVLSLLATGLVPFAASGTPDGRPSDRSDVRPGGSPGGWPDQGRIHPSDPELTRLLARDRSAHLGPDGMVFYADPIPMEQPLTSSAAPAAAYPYEDTFDLHSLPGAPRVIYLDFDGVTVQNTVWNTHFGLPGATYPGFDMDGSPGSFSQAARDVVQDVWQRVAEDFAPFAVDVTSADPGAAALNRSSSGDQEYGVRVAITGSSIVASVLCGSSCTGIAFSTCSTRPAAPATSRPGSSRPRAQRRDPDRGDRQPRGRAHAGPATRRFDARLGRERDRPGRVLPRPPLPLRHASVAVESDHGVRLRGDHPLEQG